ncbi:MAG: DNA mismatch repair endonuclease MutL [Candidatus Sumerlaeota bacterium]|nr:DNA mismatch repair endonuclease MutL [Candidatus Sumerlaeota bacterium]
MGVIQILPAVLINQIAAGEVIVRPASVIKELLENAIDAGATRVRIEVDRSCRNLTLIDNGCGMTPDDARLAIQRHATSKIRDIEDLTNITTRGFRGEALASVAAVARLEVLTRRAEDVAGFRLAIEGGREESAGPVGCAPGTTMRVRDLFFNVPARRKFLKSEASEFNAIMQLLTRQMLARGDVGFMLLREEKKLIELPTDQPLASRMVHLLGNLAEEQLLKINDDRHGIRIYGYITRPEATRKDRREQYFFVNQRPVTHRTMGFSLEQAFHGLLMGGRHPVCCLFIEIPPGEVDVNVHPTKEEVRFRDESKVTGVLNHAVSDALRQANLTAAMRLPPGAPNKGTGDLAPDQRHAEFAQRAEQLGFAPPSTPYAAGRLPDLPAPEKPLWTGKTKISSKSSPQPTASTPSTAPAFQKKSEAAPDDLRFGPEDDNDRAASTPMINNHIAPSLVAISVIPCADDSSTPLDLEQSSIPNPQSSIPNSQSPIPTLQSSIVNRQSSIPTLQSSIPNLQSAIRNPQSAISTPQPLGQIADCYLVASLGDDLVVVDQHAAHERINFNRVMAAFERGGADTQPLLIPVTFDVPARDLGRIEELVPLLKSAGIEVEHFGGRTYVVRGIPASMPDMDIAAAIQDLLSEEREASGLTGATPQEKVAARIACHASIKANQHLSPEEQKQLLRDIFAAEDPYTCPHGRPTIIRLTRAQLDRQFGRG